MISECEPEPEPSYNGLEHCEHKFPIGYCMKCRDDALQWAISDNYHVLTLLLNEGRVPANIEPYIRKSLASSKPE